MKRHTVIGAEIAGTAWHLSERATGKDRTPDLPLAIMSATMEKAIRMDLWEMKSRFPHR